MVFGVPISDDQNRPALIAALKAEASEGTIREPSEEYNQIVGAPSEFVEERLPAPLEAVVESESVDRIDSDLEPAASARFGYRGGFGGGRGFHGGGFYGGRGFGGGYAGGFGYGGGFHRGGFGYGGGYGGGWRRGGWGGGYGGFYG